MKNQVNRQESFSTETQPVEDLDRSIALSTPSPDTSAPKISGYTLINKLGAGAFGEVWKATQERTQKVVAVKIFTQRSGLNWLFLRREVERLALLDEHPGIITLLDTDFEHEPPFYAMHLIERGTLADWVRPESPVPLKRVIEWMRQIAEALAFVHGKGMIHCDLKPSNILVDLQGRMRIADFGQAQVFTESQVSFGTPFFMAPEQAVPSTPQKLVQPDVRWDIYGFGATIYSLLVGHAPHESPSNMLRIKSTSALPDRLKLYKQVIEEGGSNLSFPDSVDREMSGIMTKCLAFRPEDRYECMRDILSDLDARHSGHPVSPLAHSRFYRMNCFVQRNRISVATMLFAFVALVGGLIGMTWMYLRAERSQIEATIARDEAKDARNRAIAEANTAKQVTDFLVELFHVYDPDEAGGNIVTTLDFLKQGAETIPNRFNRQPNVQVVLMDTLANIFWRLGEFALASELAEQVWRIQLRDLHLPEEHPKVMSTRNLLANVLHLQGKYEEAERLLQESLKLARQHFSNEHTQIVSSLNRLANVMNTQGKYLEAERFLREALTIGYQHLGSETRYMAWSQNILGSVLHSSGKYGEAEDLLRNALSVSRQHFGNEHRYTASSLTHLAKVLHTRGDYHSAEDCFREALRIRRKLLGEQHPDVAQGLGYLARTLERMDRLDDAEMKCLKAIKHPHASAELKADASITLCVVLAKRQRFVDAESAMLESIDMILNSARVPKYDKKTALQRIVAFYDAWHSAEPEKGYDQQSARWRAKLELTEVEEG